MNSSILRKLHIAFLGFGLLMGIIFPFFASLFVDYKEGFYIWFVISCLVAGVAIGVINYFMLKTLLISKLKDIWCRRCQPIHVYFRYFSFISFSHFTYFKGISIVLPS